MTKRQRQLIRAEILRHEALAEGSRDEVIKRDHQEVARALRSAVTLRERISLHICILAGEAVVMKLARCGPNIFRKNR